MASLIPLKQADCALTIPDVEGIGFMFGLPVRQHDLEHRRGAIGTLDRGREPARARRKRCSDAEAPVGGAAPYDLGQPLSPLVEVEVRGHWLAWTHRLLLTTALSSSRASRLDLST